jgi:hypothetical protein
MELKKEEVGMHPGDEDEIQTLLGMVQQYAAKFLKIMIDMGCNPNTQEERTQFHDWVIWKGDEERLRHMYEERDLAEG